MPLMSGLEPFKAVFSALALVLTLGAFVPYIVSIVAGRARPHVFSWIIWGSATVVVCAAQLADGGGIGAWPIGVSGAITFGVAALAWIKSGDRSIRPADWVFLGLALLALPLWWLTSSPLVAVVILTLVDLSGFGPTVRSAWSAPHQESALFFGTAAVRNGLVVLALEAYTWTTVLFPAVVGGACLGLVMLLLLRRSVVRE